MNSSDKKLLYTKKSPYTKKSYVFNNRITVNPWDLWVCGSKETAVEEKHESSGWISSVLCCGC
jgi:hypothetical protein